MAPRVEALGCHGDRNVALINIERLASALDPSMADLLMRAEAP